MATNVPPHKPAEVLNAAVIVMKTLKPRWPFCSIGEKAPTFPSAAKIITRTLFAYAKFTKMAKAVSSSGRVEKSKMREGRQQIAHNGQSLIPSIRAAETPIGAILKDSQSATNARPLARNE